MKIGLHEDAEAELLEAANWYESRSAGLGHAFLTEFERCTGLMLSSPAAFPVTSSKVRHVLFRKFPYRLLYIVERRSVLVLAVAHHKRRPGYWVDRR